MSTSRLARVLTLAAAALLTVPLGAQAEVPPPETASFTYTPNLEPIGSSPHAPRASGVFNSDLAFWGDTAYQGNYDGFRIIDISDPANPAEVLNYDECRGNQGDVIIWDDILVRSWNSGALPSGTPPALPTCDGQQVPLGWEGIHIFDVSNPADPDLIASEEIFSCGSHTATGVPDLANNRLLVYNNPSAGNQCAGFDIIEIPLADPANPDNLGVANTGRACHDVAVILGDAMLAACAGGNGLTMMSIGGTGGGTLTAPTQLWTKNLSSEMVSIGHAASFSWDGEIVLFGHEPGGGGQAACEESDDPRLRTMFMFNTADGAEVGRWTLPRPQGSNENCTIHNFNVVPSASKRILVQGNYQAGISVIDFTNPAQAQEIAYADPAPLAEELQLGGDWSSYWYNGTIYESDITRGLIDWKLNDPAVAGAQTLEHLNPQTQEFTIPFTGQITTERCGGKAVTLFGSAGDDLLSGTPKADVIVGGAGNDRIIALKGDDVVCAGAGNDKVSGSGGNDILKGQAGKDNLRGGGGRDRLIGGKGRDRCHGGPGDDVAKSCKKKLQI
jgi:hypothetical protein